MTFSMNNRVITEQYVKEAIKSTISGGIATPGQKNGLKGLRVLMDARLADGRVIPKGSTAYVREEALFVHAWASKPLTCDTLSEKFLIVGLEFVEYFDIPQDVA